MVLPLPRFLAALALSVWPAAALAQSEPDAAGLFQRGRAALDAGDPLEARVHLARGLALAPGDPQGLGWMLEASASDADARLLWTHAWYAATTGARGGGAAPAHLAEGVGPKRVAKARAAAVSELLAWAAANGKKARRDASRHFVARWARALALRLAEDAPALRAVYGDELEQEFKLPVGFSKGPRAALKKLLRSALSRGDDEVAVRAARILRGLGAQSRFRFLRGKAPGGADRDGEAAARALDELRRRLARRQEPWSLDDLDWFALEEGERFTRDHGTWARPGVATSPGGAYRIETDCGHATLLGAAETIELHHARLARWFGTDPFEGRPGLVRIVPSAVALEAEGAPHFWVGGFQSGDVTTVRFSQSDLESLGRALTHELTHRFDGALFPGIPAWLAEGRAVWTAAAYGEMRDRDFEPQFASFRALQDALIRGYGGEAKLRTLVEGTVRDYRDNYVAGHALYVYLETWEEEGRRLYRDALRRFLRAGSSDAPMKRFVDHFADGREGRPRGFGDFARAFGGFLQGFHWMTPRPWRSRYLGQVVPPSTRPAPIYDEPTWSWEWVRSEPWFGQGQARLAAELLLDQGLVSEALAAFAWALAVDVRDGRILRGAERACSLKGRADAAWVLAAELTPLAGGSREPAPFLDALPRTRALLEALSEAAAEARTSGAAVAAASLAGARDDLAARLGLPAAPGPESESEPESEPGADSGEPDLPFDPPARALTADGVLELDLFGYDDLRVPGLWAANDSGDLVVGWEGDKSFTGRVDRTARQRDAFVASRRWLPRGAYSLKTRLRFLTGYVSGAVVIGYGRRDRHVRFEFSAGDVQYAVGIEDTEPTFESIQWKVNGLHEREDALGESPGGRFSFGRSRPSLDLELRVEDATLEVFLDGVLVGAYTTPDGTPLVGRVGFAAGFGAYRAISPTVARLDRARAARADRYRPLTLDLEGRAAPGFRDLENHRLIGLEPRSNGRLVLWSGNTQVQRMVAAVERLGPLLWRTGHPQELALVVPASLSAAETEGLAREARELLERPVPVLSHALGGSPRGGRSDGSKLWLLFLDDANVVRVATNYQSQRAGLDERFDRWLRVFRDHGHPPRELPAAPRRSGPEAEQGTK